MRSHFSQLMHFSQFPLCTRIILNLQLIISGIWEQKNMTTKKEIKCNESEKIYDMCFCMFWVWVHTCTHEPVQDRGQAVVSFFRSLLPCFFRQSFSSAGAHWFAQTGCPKTIWYPSPPSHPAQCSSDTLVPPILFYMDSGDQTHILMFA